MNFPISRSPVDIDVIEDDLRQKDIKTLDYEGSQFGNLEAIYLASRFFINKSIITINLQHNQIGDDGIVMLAEALKEQLSVSAVKLSNNLFGYIGVLALAELKEQRPEIDIDIDLSSEVLSMARQRKRIDASRAGLSNQSQYAIEADQESDNSSLWTIRSKEIADSKLIHR